MKNLIFIILMIIFTSSSQEKEKIVFLFENGKDSIIKNKYETIYKIRNKHSFKFIEKLHQKNTTRYNSIKDEITSYDDFIQKNKGKNFPDFFSNYSFFVFILEKDNTGCLFEVEKIWLVEENIID